GSGHERAAPHRCRHGGAAGGADPGGRSGAADRRRRPAGSRYHRGGRLDRDAGACAGHRRHGAGRHPGRLVPDRGGAPAGEERTMITVVLVEDETLIRQALTSLLSLEDDIEVVATAASGGEALDTIRHHRPDVALLDLQMPEPNGIAVAAELRQEMPDCGCVIVTSHGRPGYLRTALASGARGFVPKTGGAAALAQVVRTVADGGRYVDPELAAEAMAAGDSPLTAREADVLALAFEGSPVDE